MLAHPDLTELPEETESPEPPAMFPDQLDLLDLLAWLVKPVNLDIPDQRDQLDQKDALDQQEL